MMLRGDIDGCIRVLPSTSWFQSLLSLYLPEDTRTNALTTVQLEDYGSGPLSNGMDVSRELADRNPEAVAGLVRACEQKRT